MAWNNRRRTVLAVCACALSYVLYVNIFHYDVVSKIAGRYYDIIGSLDKFDNHVTHRNQPQPIPYCIDDPIERHQKSDANICSQEAVYKQRRLVLLEACKRAGTPVPHALSSENIPDNFLVERPHSILYCRILKSGSTFWLRTLSVMTRGGEYSSPFQLRYTSQGLVTYRVFKQQDKYELDKFLSTATSFLFTREPYGRLFASYVNKLYNANTMYWKRWGRRIILLFRNDSSEQIGNDITFEEYVKYVLMKHASGMSLDSHLRPMHKACDVCSMPFDFIGRIETFKNDADYLLSQWQSKNDTYVKFTDFNKEREIDTIKGHLKFVFGAYGFLLKEQPNMKYPKYMLLMKLWRVLQIRGILWKTIEMPLSKKVAENCTRDDFLGVIENAMKVPVDNVSRNRQKQEAMAEAYATLSLDDLYKVREFVRRDCESFGFEDTPAILFDREHTAQTVKGTFRYFI